MDPLGLSGMGIGLMNYRLYGDVRGPKYPGQKPDYDALKTTHGYDDGDMARARDVARGHEAAARGRNVSGEPGSSGALSGGKASSNTGNAITVAVNQLNKTMTITVKAYVGGKASDIVPGTDLTYIHAALAGILKYWETQDAIDGWTVDVNIFQTDSRENAYVIDIVDINSDNGFRSRHTGGGVNYWKKDNIGYTTLVAASGWTDSGGYTYFDYDFMQYKAAHEFGHALGIGDAYTKGDNIVRMSPPNDIMLTRQYATVTSLDLTLVRTAHSTNAYQNFPEAKKEK